MRAVIDTNVLLSGLFWRGAPHHCWNKFAAGSSLLVASPELLDELATVVGRPKFAAIVARTNISREHLLDEVYRLSEVIEPTPLPGPICRDPDDDAVLALAVAANADWIVSGDQDLLSLREFQGIRVVNPEEAVGILLSI